MSVEERWAPWIPSGDVVGEAQELWIKYPKEEAKSEERRGGKEGRERGRREGEVELTDWPLSVVATSN